MAPHVGNKVDGKQMEVLGECQAQTGLRAPHPFPHTSSYSSLPSGSSSVFFFIIFNRPVSICAFLASLTYSSKFKLERGWRGKSSGNFQFVPNQVRSTDGLVIGIGSGGWAQPLGTEPLTCGIGSDAVWR